MKQKVQALVWVYGVFVNFDFGQRALAGCSGDVARFDGAGEAALANVIGGKRRLFSPCYV